MIAEALFCLALNAYHEARNQGMRGMAAVSQVVINRVESDLYPSDVCGVVFQGPTKPSWKNPKIHYPVRHRCQFSWYCDGKDDTPRDQTAWNEARLVATGVLYGRLNNYVGDSLWYHAHYVTPGWAKSKKKIAEIGDHIFYEKKY